MIRSQPVIDNTVTELYNPVSNCIHMTYQKSVFLVLLSNSKLINIKSFCLQPNFFSVTVIQVRAILTKKNQDELKEN